MEGEQEVEEEVADQGTTPRERAENGWGGLEFFVPSAAREERGGEDRLERRGGIWNSTHEEEEVEDEEEKVEVEEKELM